MEDIAQKLRSGFKNNKEDSKSKVKKRVTSNLEDEDIVNRDSSFLTDEYSQSNNMSTKEKPDGCSEDEIYWSDSPKINKNNSSKLLNANSNNRYYNTQVQPQGEQEDEMMLGIDDFEGLESKELVTQNNKSKYNIVNY